MGYDTGLMARPRSEHARRKVLKAALDLMAERGIEGTSMDEIVRLSGVSKATVYKHWPNKELLYMEAIATLSGKTPDFNSGNPRADVVDFLSHLAHRRRPKAFMRIFPKVVGYAARHPKFAKAWHSNTTVPRRSQLCTMLQRAASCGDLRPDIDTDLAMDLLIGPIMHHRLWNDRVPPDIPERVVEAFWRAFSPTRK